MALAKLAVLGCLIAASLVVALGAGAAVPAQAPGLGLLQTSTRKFGSTHTCQATSRDRQTSGPTIDLVGSPKRTAVVACEQPPKSELILPHSVKAGLAAAIASLG